MAGIGKYFNNMALNCSALSLKVLLIAKIVMKEFSEKDPNLGSFASL